MKWQFVACLLILSSHAYAFKVITVHGKPTAWRDNTIYYTFDSTGSNNFINGCDKSGSCISEKDAVRRAFRSWQSIDGARIQFSEKPEHVFRTTGYDNENSIKWVESNWRGQSFFPPSAAIAVTITTFDTTDGRIRDADIHFNGEDFEWAVIDTDNEATADIVDVENIAAHEIGHYLGLDHSSEDYLEKDMSLYLATMFYASGPGETMRRQLKSDDTNAAKHLYPEIDVPHPIVDDINPKILEASASDTTMEITGDSFGPTTTVVLTGGAQDDIVGKIVSVENGKMIVDFDLYGAPSNEYTLVVANSVDTQEIETNAVQVNSPYGQGFDNNGNYGSNSGYATNEGCMTQQTVTRTLADLILLLLVPLLLVSVGRPDEY